MESETGTVYTIGHSTRSLEDFMEMLKSFKISHLADVRHYPGSKRYPHFNSDSLRASLQSNGIGYTHFIDLGGRRKASPDSVNTAWRNAAFRGYADYMQTNEFSSAIQQLTGLAKQQPTAYMCSEAVWWRCHRSMISDYLKVRGWTVLHIMSVNKADEHPYTSAAKVSNGTLSYAG